MCLYISEAQAKRQLVQKKKILVYKCYDDANMAQEFLNGEVKTFEADQFYQNNTVVFSERKTIVSSRKNTKLTEREKSNRIINLGLHCFLSKALAIKKMRWIGTGNSVVLSFWASPKDFVARDRTEIVYHKLTFNKIESICFH